MKKSLFVITGIIIIMILVMCEKGSENSEPEDLFFIKTELGGCHETDFSDLKSTDYDQSDTVMFAVKNDTLDIFIGVNYICCAPFTSQATISDNIITITINDICQINEGLCYCRCMCYYTWNFVFSNFQDKDYHYKIILNDPQQESPVLIEEGNLSLN